MIESRHRPGFAFEALAETLGGNLHRAIAPEARIPTPIDFPMMPAPTESRIS